MKKTFKRAGVAVLSMAMLLSMGAMTAISSSALDTTTQQYIKMPTGPDSTTYSIYKLADVTVNGGAYDYAVHSKDLNDSKGFETILSATDGKLYCDSGTTLLTENMGAAAKMALAKSLANSNVLNEETAIETGIALGAVRNLLPGYYLIVNSGTATPILLSVRSDQSYTTSAAALPLEDKSNGVTIDKAIEKINNVAQSSGADIQSDKNKANAAVGDTVSYSLTTKTPKYDSHVTGLAYPFTITDTPEAGKLSIKTDTVKITINGTEYTATTADVVTITKSTSSLTFVVDDDYILAKNSGGDFINQDKDVVVTFDAEILSDADTGTNSNDNTTHLSYDNDFTTDGTTGSEGTDDDTVAVFVPEFDVTKHYDGAVSSTQTATFKVYKFDDSAANKRGAEVTTASTTTTDATLEFKNLKVGKYVLAEDSTTGEYRLAEDIIFEITDDSTNPYYGSFHYTKTTANDLDKQDGKGATTVNNISGQKLPGTGGMGTILFTVGGAAVVLLAGALFVVYMRKRKVEE